MTIGRRQAVIVSLVAAIGLVTQLRPAAADPLNLESGLPLEMEDAYAAPFLNREYQTYLRYERDDDGRDFGRWVNRLEVGLWYNTELTVEVPLVFGEIEPDGLGDVSVELLYNFNQESQILPAFALAGTLITPTGDHSRGLDPEIEFIATKTLPGTWDLHRLHFNFSYRFNDEVRSGERGGIYHVVVGYEVRATNNLVLLADLVREEDLEKGVEINLIEGGGRYRLTPYALLAVGLGFGIADESP
ncbi:MAG: transporter, partial [Candidatus Binatia bacterium]